MNQTNGSLRLQFQAVGVFMALLPIVFFALLIWVWPYPSSNGSPSDVLAECINPEQRLMIIVLLSGAVGSSVQAARSFVAFVGRDEYEGSWTWWYLTRVPVGMGLALILYFVLRGGLIAGNANGATKAIDVINPFGFAGLSAMAGMFSKHVTAKLEEIFETVFQTSGKSKQTPVASPPEIDKVSSVKKGATGQDLKIVVNGSNFTKSSEIFVNQVGKRQVEFRSANELVVFLIETDAASAGSISIRVRNPRSEGGESVDTLVQVLA